jgi:hypothetical protein
MAANKWVSGTVTPMDPAEEAEFESSRRLTLPQVKRAKKGAILVRLNEAERAGFTFQTKRIPSDADSLARISIIASRARRAQADGAAFSVVWFADDDSALTLNRTELQDLDKAAGDHFKACSDNARTLRQAVSAAGTVAEVEAIDVNAGWPA